MTPATPGQAGGIEVTHDPEIAVHLVQLWLCELCLDGEGGECHTPGCALWINRAPDLPLRGNAFVTVMDAAQQPQPAPGAQCGTCDGSGMLTVPDGDGESASEQACPDPVHDGDDWFEVGDADAGTQPAPELAAAMAEARTLRTDLDEATRVMLAHHDGAVQRRGRALRKRAGLEEL